MGGSSKKVTVGYKYYLGMHMILCHGPADKLLNITVDGRKAWGGSSTGGDINISAEDLFGGEKREGGVSGRIDLEMGLPTQARNPYLQAQLGADIPAYRGVVGVVLRQCYLGLNPYLKKWAFRLTRVYKRAGGKDQWYPEKAAIPLASFSFAYDDIWKYKVVPASEGGAFGVPAEYINPNYDDSGWPTGKGGFGSGGPGAGLGVGTYVSPEYGKSIWLRKEILANEPSLAGDIYVTIWHDDGRKLWWNGEEIEVVQQSNYFHSTAVIPSSKVRARNVIVLQVIDSIPGGLPSNIYAGMALQGGISDQVDMNPAHIIRECLTDPDWGMGYQEADIDDASFTAAADALHAEMFGLSILWDRQSTIEDFVKEIIRHINAVLYVDRTSGKFRLKLIRGDYNESSLLTLGPGQIDKVENFSRPAFGELTNSVTVNYHNSITNKEASVSAQDPALVQMQGAVVGTTIQYPGCTNASLASRLALRDLQTLSSPLLSCTIYADRTAATLDIGSVFRLDWPDLLPSPVVMRVIGLALGDGATNTVKVTCVEDAFSLPQVGSVAPPEIAWEDPSTPPAPADVRVVTEAPYYEIVQRSGQTTADELLSASPQTGYILASAKRPAGAINAVLMVDSGAGYEDSGTVEFCPSAELAEDVSETTTVLPLASMDSMDEVRPGTHAQLGQELVRIDAIGESTVTVGRGVLDTFPSKHPAGTKLLAWDAYAEGDLTEYLEGESINVKLLPVSGTGMVAIDAAPTDTILMSARATRPYPPGDYKINGVYFPDFLPLSEEPTILLSWAHRDRKQQTGGSLIDFSSGSIGPEPGVTYLVEGIANFTTSPSEEWYSENVGTVNSHAIDLVANPIPASALSVTLRVWAVRDGYRSWQPAEATVIIFTPPYDLFGTYVPG